MQHDGLPRSDCPSNVALVPDTDWRDRVEAESQLQRGLHAELSASARRRAIAFEEGVEELGSKSAVAREVGIDVRAVRRAINEYGTATSPPDGSTNE